MTKAEIIAFNAGVSAVVALAQASAAAIAARLVDKPTRYNFAVKAFQALAEAAGELALPPPLPKRAKAASGPSQARGEAS